VFEGELEKQLKFMRLLRLLVLVRLKCVMGLGWSW
jgi:hypothetical protein